MAINGATRCGFFAGISESWIAIGLCLGAWLNWRLVAGRLRLQTEKNNNALTLPDYLTSRFDDKSKMLRIVSALVILTFLPSIVRQVWLLVECCLSQPSIFLIMKQ